MPATSEGKMSESVSELRRIFEELQSFGESWNKADIVEPLGALDKAATEVGKAWSHSWLGYQSRVYYKGLEPAPPGANFSSEWGFTFLRTIETGTRGNWEQFAEDVIETEIKDRAGNPDITRAQEEAARG